MQSTQPEASGAYPSRAAVAAAIRDSLADEDDMSDFDDEVFIRDGKQGILKIGPSAASSRGRDYDDEDGVKRPLMAPRRKHNKTRFADPAGSASSQGSGGAGMCESGGGTSCHASPLPYRTLLLSYCYVIGGFLVLLCIIGLCALVVAKLPVPLLDIVRRWIAHEPKQQQQQTVTSGGTSSLSEKNRLPACTSLATSLVWTRSLPKLTAEAPLRNNDVNQDGIDDIILGFGTGLDNGKDEAARYACQLYFDQPGPCLGGVLAIDGKSGATIWQHWAEHAIFGLDCGLDLNYDRIKDCLAAGRGGLLRAVNGHDGASIWELQESARDPGNNNVIRRSSSAYYDQYDARYVADLDDDGIGDVVAAHTWRELLPVAAGAAEQQPVEEVARSSVVLVSGKTGLVINVLEVPGAEQLFVAPQTIVHPDGETYFVLAASGVDKSGGLYVVPHSKLLMGQFKLQDYELYHGPGRGVSLPPLLIDINSDQTEDIIVAVFNSTIVAIDGLTFKQLWNYTVPNSEVISLPVPGYYNDDEIPDFMVKHQIGPGFPVYYYTEAQVLDGRTGKPLLEAPIVDTMSAQMSGLTLSVEGTGNDWFLHWSADCRGREAAQEPWALPKTDATEPAWRLDGDLCGPRYNSSLVRSLLAFGQHVAPPGQPIYKSDDWTKLEYNNTVDPRKEAEDYVRAHGYLKTPRGGDTEEGTRDRNLPVEAVAGSYYPNGNERSDDNVDDERERQKFYEKALNGWSEYGWRNNRKQQQQQQQQPSEDNYDDASYDDDEEKLIASRQLNEIRLQRSEKSDRSGRYVNNDTNDVQNQLDPSMDYTNGQSKLNNYYSSLSFNRSSNADDSLDYMNLPDIDFVDNIKEAEALSARKKKRRRRNAAAVRKRRAAAAASALDESTGAYGVQRQPPTGIILPSLKPVAGRNPVDLIYSTYWLPSASSSPPFVLLRRDLDCIEKRRRESKLSEEEERRIVAECLRSRGVEAPRRDPSSTSTSKIPLGQMTLYRLQLSCVCPEDMLPGQTCRDISTRQSWPQYLGRTGAGYFDSRKPNK
ncbi:hypothetical protein TKK_0004645 [Trichogramma kaykai]|uniref:FAM234A/B beta-propeller domain-containing protein n=1 Tax=Trichogramma kaykai TaxID=54128 RepID=A0ABD2XP50_9HYME